LVQEVVKDGDHVHPGRLGAPGDVLVLLD
jgi:hypothetical protein